VQIHANTVILKLYTSVQNIYINNLNYQQIVQQISLMHIYRRLLQHVSAISYSQLQGALIYKIVKIYHLLLIKLNFNSVYIIYIPVLPEDGYMQ